MRTAEEIQTLSALCRIVRKLIGQGDFAICEKRIRKAMCQYPHAPEPHNLLGILLERMGDSCGAMKHFRAALGA